jgi:hypothetical protein
MIPMSIIFPPPRRVTHSVHGEDEYLAVRRLTCAGANHAAQMREIGDAQQACGHADNGFARLTLTPSETE